VAIPKVCGIETEYAIQAAGPDANPVSASSVLVNAYAASVDRRTGWDFEDESPDKDARGYAREGAMPPVVETHLANTVLTNGARYYVDHAHPEYSTPECIDALELVCHDKAGEEVLRRSMVAAAALPSSPSVGPPRPNGVPGAISCQLSPDCQVSCSDSVAKLSEKMGVDWVVVVIAVVVDWVKVPAPCGDCMTM